MRSALPAADYDTIVTEVRASIGAETEFAREADVQERLADFFADHPRIDVPRPLRALSGARVLTSTFMEGRRITLVARRMARPARRGRRRKPAPASTRRSACCSRPTRGRCSKPVCSRPIRIRAICSSATDGQAGAPRLRLRARACRPPRDGATRSSSSRSSVATPRASRSCSPSWASAPRAGAPTRCCISPRRCSARCARPRSKEAACRGSTRPQLAAQARALLDVTRDDPVVRIPEEFAMLARVFGALGGLFQHYRPRLDWTRTMQPLLGALAAH